MCHILCQREIKPYNTEKHPARFFFRLRGDSQEPGGSPDTQAQPSLLIHMAHYVVPLKKKKKGTCPTEPGWQHSVYSQHYFAHNKLGQKCSYEHVTAAHISSCLHIQTTTNMIFFKGFFHEHMIKRLKLDLCSASNLTPSLDWVCISCIFF